MTLAKRLPSRPGCAGREPARLGASGALAGGLRRLCQAAPEPLWGLQAGLRREAGRGPSPSPSVQEDVAPLPGVSPVCPLPCQG